MLIDLGLLLFLIGIAYRVSQAGAWGGVTRLFCTFFAGVVAMNLFEPAAEWLQRHVSEAAPWRERWDVIALLGIFSVAVMLLRMITERLAPASLPIAEPLETLIGWLGGVGCGFLMTAILLTALHVAPFPRLVTESGVREVAGFQPEREHLFGLAPDQQWLALVQQLSLRALNRGDSDRIFDGPIYRSAGGVAPWPSFALKYAARREFLTRERLGLSEPRSLE